MWVVLSLRHNGDVVSSNVSGPCYGMYVGVKTLPAYRFSHCLPPLSVAHYCFSHCLPPSLFGGCSPVGACALGGELHGGAVARVVDDLGQAEVRDLHVAVLVEQDVARLEVVVDDALSQPQTRESTVWAFNKVVSCTA